jgi:hypothetical protein
MHTVPKRLILTSLFHPGMRMSQMNAPSRDWEGGKPQVREDPTAWLLQCPKKK